MSQDFLIISCAENKNIGI